MPLPLSDPRKILETPLVYNFFQKAVGAEKSRQQFFEQYVSPLAPARILEVGCGPGTNCQWMADGIEYVGCDLSEDYIEYARKKFGSRAEFHATPVGGLGRLGLKPFDAIIALAVLHHLNDDEVVTLCDEGYELLRPGGVLITGDPCFTAEQSWLSRFLTAHDRGRFVRYPQQYQALVNQRFSQVYLEVRQSRLLVVDQPGTLLRAIKS